MGSVEVQTEVRQGQESKEGSRRKRQSVDW